MSNKVTANDIEVGGISLVALNEQVQALQTQVNSLPTSTSIPTNLTNIKFDSYGRIIGDSIAPATIATQHLTSSTIRQEHLASAAVTTDSVLSSAITQTALQENTGTQSITTTVVSGTTPPPSGFWNWTQIANLSITPFNKIDDILLHCFVQSSVSFFFLSATQNAVTGSGITTVVNDIMSIRFLEVNTSTIIKEFDINLGLNSLDNAGTSELTAWAAGLKGSAFSYTISHVFSGFSNINLIVQVAGVDMVRQYKSGYALTVSVNDVLVSLTDLQR